VRVDRLRDGQLRVIPEQELQDKSDRYYFRDTMALQRGEIFLSPLDLNVEHGQVEVPYNPMLRMATRLFAEGGRSRGMLILNLSAAHLLQRFTEIESQGPGLCLLNNDGYWLESPHSDDEWGFMFGRKETFAQRYPSLWPRMAAQEQGEFDYEHGHWLWTSVYPAPAVNGPPMRWQIVTHLSPAVLKEIASQVWLPLLGGALLLLVLFAVLVWRLVRVRAEKHRAELALLAHRAIDASTRQANEQLEQRVQQRTAELAQANAELQRSNRELDEFAYIASHDLKEPLRGIHNYASFLQEDYAEQLDQQGRDFLQRMQRLAERQTELIDRLMAYSRVGRAEMDRAPVDLGRLLDDVEEDLRLFLQEQGAVIQRASTLPVVCCNRTRVGEVLQNLISNAVKYNDNTDKRIEVGCDESGRERVFYVRDNGIGIPPQHQEGVFRIFKRLHEQSRYGGGTGAGLTIVKKIIERHGGRIWLQSTPGQGASFYFTLGEPTT
jgi:signal transduction histidine kinase